MTIWRKSLLAGLTGAIVLAQTLPVLAESMYIPRLGYPTTGAKRIYLDIVTPEQHEAMEKAKKEQEKAKRKESKEKAESKSGTKQEESAKNGDELDKEQQQALKEARRQQVMADRSAKIKAILDQRQAKRDKRPVDGGFYLYDLKNNRLIFNTSAELQATESEKAVGPFYVEFTEFPEEGLFDVAVRGSGHRSQQPIRVSDTLFWDALQPVTRDINKTHCPVEKGRFRILQQCYFLNIPQNDTQLTGALKRPLIVQGGWFVDETPTEGVVKDTTQIAKTSQMLLNLYDINPQSYKYLVILGPSYSESAYPDILDEANWGLKYLLTSQKPNGGIPAGIKRAKVDGVETYSLMPESPESTAYGVMALATAVKSFHKEDLSLAVQYLRAAEKGWRYLQTTKTPVNPEWMLMASGALARVSDAPEYTKAYQEAKAQVREVSPETGVLMGAMADSLNVAEPAMNLSATNVSEVFPLIVKLRKESASTMAIQPLQQWVTDLYGYTEISLAKDPNLEVASAWVDPLQWMATKTGEVASRVGQKLMDEGVIRPDPKERSKQISVLDEKETEAQKRIEAGYKTLSLTTTDKAYLAYLLGLMNQRIAAPEGDPGAKKPEPEPSNYGEDGSIKGFYPKPI